MFEQKRKGKNIVSDYWLDLSFSVRSKTCPWPRELLQERRSPFFTTRALILNLFWYGLRSLIWWVGCMTFLSSDPFWAWLVLPNSCRLTCEKEPPGLWNSGDKFDIGVAAVSFGLGLFEGGCAEPVEDEGLSGVLSSLLLPAGGMVSRRVLLFTLPIVGVKL